MGWIDPFLTKREMETRIKRQNITMDEMEYNGNLLGIDSQKNQNIGGNFYYFDDKTMLAKIEISGIIIMK